MLRLHTRNELSGAPEERKFGAYIAAVCGQFVVPNTLGYRFLDGDRCGFLFSWFLARGVKHGRRFGQSVHSRGNTES